MALLGRGAWATWLVIIIGGGAALAGCSSAMRTTSPAPVRASVPNRLGKSCPEAPARATSTGVPGASKLLIPFTPTTILICRDGGMNSGRYRQLVARARVSSPAEVHELVEAVDESGRHRLVGTDMCPADFGTITTLTVLGARSVLVLSASRTGCAIISNGRIVDAWISSGLAKLLTRLVGRPGS